MKRSNDTERYGSKGERERERETYLPRSSIRPGRVRHVLRPKQKVPQALSLPRPVVRKRFRDETCRSSLQGAGLLYVCWLQGYLTPLSVVCTAKPAVRRDPFAGAELADGVCLQTDPAGFQLYPGMTPFGTRHPTRLSDHNPCVCWAAVSRPVLVAKAVDCIRKVLPLPSSPHVSSPNRRYKEIVIVPLVRHLYRNPPQ